MKNINRVFILILGLLLVNTSYAADIESDSMDVVDTNTIEFSLENQVNVDVWFIEWEVKILNDIEISSVEKDPEEFRKVIIHLWKTKLKENRAYSLLTILWAEWNLDFVIWNTMNDFEIKNDWNLDEQAIESIIIRDESTIDVYYKDYPGEEDIEFKLLSPLEIGSFERIWTIDNNDYRINLWSSLEVENSYILMLVSITDNNDEVVEFQDWIYDFVTDESLEEVIDDEGDVVEEDSVVEEESGTGEVDTVDNLSLNAAETPDSWAETNVLIALTFLVNSFVFMRKKIFKK